MDVLAIKNLKLKRSDAIEMVKKNLKRYALLKQYPLDYLDRLQSFSSSLIRVSDNPSYHSNQKQLKMLRELKNEEEDNLFIEKYDYLLSSLVPENSSNLFRIYFEHEKIIAIREENQNIYYLINKSYEMLACLDEDIDYTIDENEITIEGVKPDKADTVEADFTFQISVQPGFTGDITATIQGKGVDEELSAVVATAAAPVTVTAESTDAVIDYRQTDIGDITITEAEAGVLGKDDVLQLEIENIDFDDDPVVEVASGDLKIEDVDTNGGALQIKIKSESSKEPAVIKVTGVNLYMERNIPAGSYALKLSASDTMMPSDATGMQEKNTNVTIKNESKDAIFKNSIDSKENEDHTPFFDKRSVTVLDDYVNVVTAGRDQGDNTFTTQIKVTIGATEMYANDQAIALDVPAYISNGYTMLPVRAVTEALSSVAVVRWDDPTHTVTISFGERVVKMTVGSNVMVVNGVEVPMQAQCEITGERAFIPLRDMGYALGLNDSKIVWDDATKTATLN